MPRFCVVILLVAALLSGGDRQLAIGQSSTAPVPDNDAEFTGLPPQPPKSSNVAPRRATLVSLPKRKAARVTKKVTSTTSIHHASPVRPASAQSAFKPALAPPPPIPPGLPPSAVSAPPVAASPPAALPPSPSLPEPTPSPSAASESAPPNASPTLPSPDPATATDNSPSADLPDSNEAKVVVIGTSLGRIVIALDDFAAPKTCKNFRQLIQDGFYNDTVFHRVIPNFIIQGGDPKSKSSATNRDTYGLGGPGYTIPPEIELKHDRGAVAMARLPDSVNPGRESNGSQFYICLAPSPSLDDQYTVFGHVIQGMDVADKIAEAPRDKRDNPLSRIEMTVSLEPKDQVLHAGSTANP